MTYNEDFKMHVIVSNCYLSRTSTFINTLTFSFFITCRIDVFMLCHSFQCYVKEKKKISVKINTYAYYNITVSNIKKGNPSVKKIIFTILQKEREKRSSKTLLNMR